MKPLPSYPIRMLLLAFWIIVVVVFKDSAAAKSVFDQGLSWFACVVGIFVLWLLTAFLIPAYGIKAVVTKIIPEIIKDILATNIKQLPFLLPALAISLILMLVGQAHSSPVFMFIGVTLAFLSIWIIDWPQKKWYKISRKTKK